MWWNSTSDVSTQNETHCDQEALRSDIEKLVSALRLANHGEPGKPILKNNKKCECEEGAAGSYAGFCLQLNLDL